MNIIEILWLLGRILPCLLSGQTDESSLNQENEADSVFETTTHVRSLIEFAARGTLRGRAKTKDAGLGEFPYLGAVLRAAEEHCGACIISADRVISPAQCLNRSDLLSATELDIFSVVVGENELSKEGHIQWRTVVSLQFSRIEMAAEEMAHPDFAILKVNSPFWLNWRVKAIHVSLEEFRGRSVCSLIGWGSQEGKDERSQTFRVQKKTEIFVTDRQTCIEAYPEKQEIFIHAFCGESLNTKNKIELEENVRMVVCDDILVGAIRGAANEEPLVLADLGKYSQWARNYINLGMVRSLHPPVSLASKTPSPPSQIGYLCNLFLSLIMWVCVLCVLK